MKDREFRKLKAGTARTSLAMFGLLGLALAAVVPVRAQEAGATNALSGPVVTAYLDYQDANYSPMTWGVKVVTRSSAFKKEPAFSRGEVIRGTLQLVGGASNEVAFAWDRGARKLYVDLNRNLDLTDDPGGVFSCASGYGDWYQTFTNIHLPFNGATGGRQMLVDLTFSDYQGLYCTASLRSFWQGKVTLQGEEWQVGLLGARSEQQVSVEGGNLLLRPWSARNKPFSVNDGSLAAFPFSRKLFFGNRACQLQCTNEVQGGAGKVRMQFAEQEPKLGELKIMGQFVERVTLEGGPYLVVLDQPGATVKVPVGRYKEAKVCLRRGDVTAHLDGPSETAVGRITVAEKAPAVLTAGGPLTNSVAIERRGRNLTMSYRLTGVGGLYQMVEQDRSHPPEFTIYQGDKKVASGKFEFG
ncbi:MAG: hypothetical protein ABSD29_21235 [Verrucomicrobiota bacterium]|jgi:hypothetical protein